MLGEISEYKYLYMRSMCNEHLIYLLYDKNKINGQALKLYAGESYDGFLNGHILNMFMCL